MKDKLLLLLYFAGLMGMSWSGYAQSLFDVYEKARAQDNQFGAARRSLEASLEKLPQAFAGFLPTVSLVANKNQQIGEASFSSAPYVSREVKAWNWTTQLTQPVIRLSNWVA